jgi:hypothetical protein
MSRLSSILRRISGGQVSYWCPGCEQIHAVKVTEGGWTWNNDVDKPTFSPSILVTSGHYSSLHITGSSCWCTFNASRPENEKSFECRICHCFIKDGMIQFLSDSTHHLSGQIVAIPDLPDWMS